MRCPADHHDRRTFLGLLTVGLAVTVAACGGPPGNNQAQQHPDTQPDGQRDGAPRSANPTSSTNPAQVAPIGETVAVGPLGPIPPARPGPSQTLHSGPPGTKRICLTVDDGYCTGCVSGYVDFVSRTGIHLTFSPNGVYDKSWAPHANVLRPLIERQQIQIINHTFNHKDMRKLSDAQISDELERNDAWVVKTFGTTTRPYYRPPFGFHNPHIDGVAGRLGYTRAVLWNGSYSDSALITPAFLMTQARKYLEPGTIMLGHANHPTVLGLFDQITGLIHERGLDPVTLDEMFGTSRATG